MKVPYRVVYSFNGELIAGFKYQDHAEAFLMFCAPSGSIEREEKELERKESND